MFRRLRINVKFYWLAKFRDVEGNKDNVLDVNSYSINGYYLMNLICYYVLF